MLSIRRSNERGSANHGWLKAKHTFSFAGYRHPDYNGFSDLLVINEDRIDGGQGFPPHPHRDMEIISYIIDGALEHQDSMGNQGIVSPGGIQYMSAGTGVVHSEYNALANQTTHMLQIWIIPNKKNVSPNYGQDDYIKRLKKNELCLLVSNDGRDGSIKIQQDASLYTARLEEARMLTYYIPTGRKVWFQMIKGKVVFNDHEIFPGDGVAVERIEAVNIQAQEDSEFLLFNLR